MRTKLLSTITLLAAMTVGLSACGDIDRNDSEELRAAGVTSDDSIAKVSVVGLGMKDHAGVASRMFQVLHDEGINIQMINTSEIKISVVVAEKYTELACRTLHTAFGLDAEEAPQEEELA